MPEKAQDDSYHQLLQDYLRVCNRALEKNRDRFPYSQIWRAGEAALSGRAVEFAVVDDAPKARRAVTLEDHHLEDTKAEKTLDQEDTPQIQMLNKSYLEKVLAEPEKYIENPSLIDWDWLKFSV